MLNTVMDAAFWKNAATDPRYAELRAYVVDTWERTKSERMEVLCFDDRMRYWHTGDRSVFERPYFNRRNSLSAAAVLYLMHPEQGEYLSYVQNMIWAICDEYSWVVPAHASWRVADDVAHIDLFSAETAAALAEICALLGERLDPLLRERIHYELERRVLSTFRTRILPFEHSTNNWLSVCGCCVGVAMMYEQPEVFRSLIPRFVHIMNRFIDSFSDDGVCLEGFGYWGYGFVNFTWFADMLGRFSGGKYDLFESKKVECIAAYARKCFIKGNALLSFSDCGRRGRVFDSLQYYLTLRYPQSVQLLPKEISSVCSGSVIWMNLLRAFLFMPPADAPRALAVESYDFPMAEQVVVNAPGYSLFVKAGHNGEPHNHNDVGSFLLSTSAGQVFCDLGGGRYTKQYFQGGMDRRYAILCNSSFGHSVPIVNGAPQLCGRQYRGSIAHEGNRITVQMANAYGQASLQTLTRELVHTEDGVTLEDRFSPDVTLTERLVTLIPPTVEEGLVRVANVTLRFDPASTPLTVRTEQHETHTPGIFETLYCLDFEVKPGVGRAGFVFSVAE